MCLTRKGFARRLAGVAMELLAGVVPLMTDRAVQTRFRTKGHNSRNRERIVHAGYGFRDTAQFLFGRDEKERSDSRTNKGGRGRVRLQTSHPLPTTEVIRLIWSDARFASRFVWSPRLAAMLTSSPIRKSSVQTNAPPRRLHSSGGSYWWWKITKTHASCSACC